MRTDPEADEAAAARLGALFAQHSAALTRFAVRRVGAARAGDVVSETFLVAWRRLDEVPEDRAQSWLFTTAKNVIRHEVRSSIRQAEVLARVARADERPTQAEDHASVVVDQLLVRQTMAQLSESDQEVLRLAEWEQLATREAAAVIGCSVSAFKVRLHRARRRFTKLIAQAQESIVDEDDDQTSVLYALFANRRGATQ